MAILKTYDLKGNKLSFANWISNLSPVETPFTSMISKESVDQTRYSWQVDRLSAPMNPGFQEGSEFVAGTRPATRVFDNFTQILQKSVKITDTANKVGLYGRASEKAYQMEKAGKELRRDLEKAVLGNVDGTIGTATTPRRMKGFVGLVADLNVKDIDTGAVVHKRYKTTTTIAFGEEQIFDMTYNLYLAGSKADKVMVHPKHMVLFSNMINASRMNAERMFKNVDDKFNAYVKSFRDPLGQRYEVIPNRFMPEDKVFFFNDSDWTQMVLREPKSVELARNGSAEKHMIEMEVGLRHRNPYASGVLDLVAAGGGAKVSYGVSLTHPEMEVIGTTKLQVQAFKDGVEDGAATTALTATISPAAGITITGGNTLTLVAGKIDKDVTATQAGTYTIKIADAAGNETSVVLQVSSKDLRKAKAVKAKAE